MPDGAGENPDGHQGAIFFQKSLDKKPGFAYNYHCRPISRELRGVAQMVAHVLWEHGAGGSNPFTPTKKYLGPLAQLVRAVGS